MGVGSGLGLGLKLVFRVDVEAVGYSEAFQSEEMKVMRGVWGRGNGRGEESIL